MGRLQTIAPHKLNVSLLEGGRTDFQIFSKTLLVDPKENHKADRHSLSGSERFRTIVEDHFLHTDNLVATLVSQPFDRGDRFQKLFTDLKKGFWFYPEMTR